MAQNISSDLVRDWFLPAIECNGSVDACLAAVKRDLELKLEFTNCLRSIMNPRKRGGLDAVSDLSARVKSLENTLRFRLGILSTDRPAAWFRTSATTISGPFSSPLLEEPVFSHYAIEDSFHIKECLAKLWQENSAVPTPFLTDEPSLWRTLLILNAELKKIIHLPVPYEALRLDRLPDQLPAALESRPLRAFLLNVRQEILQARGRLDECYAKLFEKCSVFWDTQFQAMMHSNHAKIRQSKAESVREEIKKRREIRTRIYLNAAEKRALSCLGFEDLPSSDLLRRRYLELAKKLHPDRPGGDDSAFKEISSAYAQLVSRVST